MRSTTGIDDNTNMELTVQIFSGGFLEKAAPYDISYAIIEEKLNKVLPQLPVTKLIMGWAQDKELYEKTAAYLAKRNIDFYLWFPVFSETGTVKNLNALVDFEDRHIKNCEKHGEEDFSFCCPSGGQNIEKILDIFEEQFVSLPFKGIFLDRIRYPSFASGQRFGHGFKSVFSCFCPRCIKIYKKENLDVELLKTILLQPRYGSDGNPAPLGITGYRGNGEYAFNEPIISDFFKIKAKIIFQSVERICRYFRNKNYRIGLDVFAPFLSPFVGQNLKALSGLCDFIKPM
ncbi:MAG: hypothetical protein LBH43_01335, partial [Treponema sp.]|nr:hypothetical protein [Treponema sp.]